jgi:hypothetical protein
MNRSLPAVSALSVAVMLSCGVLSSQAPPVPTLTRTVYISVTDRNGMPVDTLLASDLEIKEGGKLVTVESAGRTSEPLQIDMIVDDNGTGLFRASLARFVQRMEGRAVMALRSVVGQTMRLVEFTPNVDALLTAINTLNARPGTPDGGQLLEGISEAALELHKVEARRPIIIALTVGGEEHSTVNSDFVLDQLRKSGAALYVFSVANSALRATVAAKTPKDLLQENMHLFRVLGDGPKQSGGKHQQIVASAGVLLGLQNLASELTSQYRVIYTLPAGVKRSEKLDVSVRRKDIVVRAPEKLPT